jgi:outer membrane receptor protein involved in Fe transport
VRAPNINELYAPTFENLFGALDPCSGAGGAAASKRAACLLQGATPAELGGISSCPANQCSVLVGGNPNLTPETAKTYTYGFVLTPRWVPRLAVSVDYYNIKISNLIGSGLGGANAELNSCMALANPTVCGLIKRDPFSGELYGAGYVTALNDNQGFVQTKGIDVTADYSYPLSNVWKFGNLGRLSFNFTGTYLAHYVEEPYAGTALYPGSGTYDCAGLYGTTCGTPLPHWKSKVRATWTTPWNVTASLQWRYIASTKLDGNQSNPLLTYGLTDVLPSDATTGEVNYFDVSFQWKVMDRYTLRAGVNNLTDKQPPVSDSVNLGASATGNGNTFPQVYDTLGRNLYIGLTADF